MMTKRVSLRETVAEYRAFKKARTGSSRISESELNKLARAVRAKNRAAGRRVRESAEPLNDLRTVLENYREYKMARLGESKLTYKEVRTLREAVENANRRGRRMREADENFDAQGAADAAQMADPNAVPGADPNAAAGGADQGALAEVSPEIQAQISTLLQQIQSLAQAAGIQPTGGDFDADPNAGLPAVDGMGGTTADAANQQAQQAAVGTAQMMEAVKRVRCAEGYCDEDKFAQIKAHYGRPLIEAIGATRDRIALRAAKLSTLSENYNGDFASAYFNSLGLREAVSPIEKIPSEKETARGTSDPAYLHSPVAWPDHDITGAPLQGDGAKNRDRSSVTEAYIADFYAPKLSMDTIRESMKTGLLG